MKRIVPPNEKKSSYPLSALFLLVATSAVLMAFVGPIAKELGKRDVTSLLWLALAGIFIGSFFGAIVGLCHGRRIRGLLLGLLTGAAVGLLCAPMALTSWDDPWEAFRVSAGGSIMLLAAGFAYRSLYADPISSSKAYEQLLREQKQARALIPTAKSIEE